MNPEVWFVNLGLKIFNLPRVAFAIFGFPIYFYGIILATAVVAGMIYANYEAKRIGRNPDLFIDFVFIGIIVGIIGARAYYVIFSWDNYKDNLMKIFATREGGIAIYGAVIALTIAAVIYTRRRGIEFGVFADVASPALLLGQAVGRWGNFFNREAFGGYTDSLFAMRYLKEQVDYISPEVAQHIIEVGGAQYIQVHPTFLYESMWSLTVFILINIYKYRKKFDGEIFALYLIGYGLGRVWIEGLRTDQLLIWNTGIAVSQVLSAVLVLAASGFLVYKRISMRKGAEII